MEEEPSEPSPDTLAPAEPSSSETDKEELSPAVAASAASMEEESGPERVATPAMWESGGPQQGASPDSCQPDPGPNPGRPSAVSGTSEDLRPAKRRPQPGTHIPCSSPGCLLSFPSVRDLAQHLRTHCPPTQSLEGKLFRCSALSCTESFPSMQELVAHGKLHYKPNRYFKSYLNPASFGLSPPRLRPFLTTAPGPPASSAAVWKKSQGAGGSPRRPQGGSDAPSAHAAPSRIVWEHTRGRYSCMQCAFSTASRPAMTLHLQDHRPGAPAGKAEGRARGEGGEPERRDGSDAPGPPALPHPDPTPTPLAPAVSQLTAEGELPVFSLL
ncbi:zinc finger protein 414 [Fukomys damarensis]|uniref:zinc finger protein 414 n=1 Tax=Fukomys damarensis TaxID=885580 RepID=UPI0008FF64E6|nr:zinc finger protein 414 [Fukomys damarensis]